MNNHLIEYFIKKKNIFRHSTIDDLDNITFFIKKYINDNNYMKECLIATRKILNEHYTIKYYDINIIHIINPNEYGLYWSPEKTSDILDICSNFIAIFILNMIDKN
jgi:hypothetical protein